MLSAPGLVPSWVPAPRPSADPLAQTVQTHLQETAAVADLTLDEVINDLEAALQNPSNSTPEQQVDMLRRLRAMTGAAQNMTKSLQKFGEGQTAEANMVGKLVDIDLPPEQARHAGTVWGDQAAEYYALSEQHLKQAADVLINDQALDRGIAQRVSGASAQQRRSNFWQGVGEAALGLQILAERAKNIPLRVGVLAEQGMQRWRQVEETYLAWSLATLDAWQHGQRAVAQQVELGWDVAVSAGVATRNNVVAPVLAYVSETLWPSLQQTIERAWNSTRQVGERVKHDFSSTLQARQDQRHEQADPAPRPHKPSF